MPETTPEQTETTAPVTGQQNQTQQQRRSTNNNRGGNTRNNNLATIAAAARSFKGKIEELPIIGKQYENVGVAFEILQRAVADYSVLTFTNGEHMSYVIENCEDNKKESGVGEAPKWDDTNKDDYGKQQEYSRKLDMFLKDERIYNSNMKKAYTVFHGQCTPALLSGIKSTKEYTDKNKKKDLLWLLETIRNLSIGIDETENELVTFFQTKKRVTNQYQKPIEPIDDWFERFEENWNAAEAAGSSFIPNCLLKSDKYKAMTSEELKDATKAMYIFLQSDRIRFGNKVREISESVVLGHDNFPTTMDGAYRILADTQRRLDEDRLRRGSTWNRNVGSSHYGGGGGRGTRSPRNHENLPTIPEGARIVLGRDRRVYTAQCYNCQEWGHFADQCPEIEGNGQVSRKPCNKFQSFTQKCNHNHVSYILDTGSTHNTVKDKTHVTNLTNLNKQDILHMESTTGDFLEYTQSGRHSIFDVETFYNNNTAANILAFHTLNALPNAYMFYDGRIADCFRLIYKDGREIQFTNNGRGLYEYTDPKFNKTFGPVPPAQTFVQYLQTVTGNEKLFSKKEVERAKYAVEVQEFLAWPSTTEFLEIVAGNQLRNCDLTVDDVKRAVFLYGEPVPYLQGRLTRRKPLKDNPLSRLQTPLPVELHEKRLELYIDIFHFKGCQFLLLESSRVKYIDIEDVFTQQMGNLIRMIQKIIKKYQARGLQISGVHVDNQFCNKAFENAIKPAIMIPYAAREHVSVAERRNRTVKERMRSLVAGTPYKAMPKLMIRASARKSRQMINKFPAKNGVSTTLSPEEIIEGKRSIDMSLRHIAFGQYAQVHTGTDNTARSRSVDAIALYQKNEREGYAFMSLDTGKILHSNVWKQLPITPEIITKVETIAKEIVNVEELLEEMDEHLNNDVMRQLQKQEETQQQQERNNNNNNDNNNDETTEEDSRIEEEEIEIQEQQRLEYNGIPIVEPDSSMETESYEYEDNENNENNNDPNLNFNNISNIEHEIEEESSSVPDISDTIMSESEVQDALQIDPETRDIVERQRHDQAIQQIVYEDRKRERNNEESVETKRPRRNVRSREDYRASQFIGSLSHQQDIDIGKIVMGTQHMQKKAKFDRGFRALRGKYAQATSYLSKQLKTPDPELPTVPKEYQSQFTKLVNVCFSQQMSVKKGFREFGEVAIAAMFKELRQLDEGAMPGKPVVTEIDPDTISNQEKKKALDAVNLIELKRDGRVKARSCANGSKQRMYLKEYDTVASPTVSLEGIFTTLLIGAKEDREFISFDVPGAFLQAEMAEDKLVLLKMTGKIAEMMCEVNPVYKKHLRKENGTTVLYMKVIRAIYGCIEAALQWYKMFTGTLKDEGFELNPYDRCVANKIIDGEQCTLAWHVDDVIASHKQQKVLKYVSDLMQKEYGEMKITEGKEHDFLGMKIIINNDRTVLIDMRESIKKTINYFEEYDHSVDEKTVTPAANYLLEVNDEIDELDKTHSEVFHSTTAKLLYIMQRARPDIETSVSFLMKRVSKSNLDDWKKLRRTIGFLKGTLEDLRIIGATSLSEIMTFIDSAYAVHENCRSHTGGLSSFGIGAVHARSKSSKINVKSSTESELVSTSEYLPHTLWLRHFMIGQGYEIKDNVVYQDNKSAILMEINGRNSCTGNSRHINIRYFWVKDRVDNKEVRIEYIPTHIMLADFFTKPLQGEQYRILRAYIMGWRPISELLIQREPKKTIRIKEDVGNREKKE